MTSQREICLTSTPVVPAPEGRRFGVERPDPPGRDEFRGSDRISITCSTWSLRQHPSSGRPSALSSQNRPTELGCPGLLPTLRDMATSGARKATLGGLGKWWGVLAGFLLIAAWINKAAGPPVVVGLSAVVLLWLLPGTRDVQSRGEGATRWLPQ
jgi:hypothetical protein